MNDSFEINNLEYSGEYTVEVIDAKSNKVVNKVSAPNKINPIISDLINCYNGPQALCPFRTMSAKSFNDLFKYFCIFNNTNGMTIDNNKFPMNVGYADAISNSVSSIDYFPIEEMNGTDRTLGFTLEIGENYCNNHEFNSLAIYSDWEVSGYQRYKLENIGDTNDKVLGNSQISAKVTFDIDPTQESLTVLTTLNSGKSYLCEHTVQGINKYEVRNFSDNQVIWELEVSEYYSNNDSYNYKILFGSYYVLIASNDSRKTIVFSIVSDEIQIYSYNSIITSLLRAKSYNTCYAEYHNSLAIININQLVKISKSSSNITIKTYNLSDGSIVSSITKTIQELIKNCGPDCINKNVYYNFNDKFCYGLVSSGNDVALAWLMRESYTVNSNKYKQRIGFTLLNLQLEYIGTLPIINYSDYPTNMDTNYYGNRNYLKRESGLYGTNPSPRFGWKIVCSSRTEKISETLKRYPITHSDIPDFYNLISLVNFPTLSKTDSQILRITYKLTQHNAGFPNKPTYVGLTPKL